ncbi:MAG: methylenetetrahydrofolate reductase [NAD(P)H] [Spirochaetia bacterium]|nr:methylenetetrahydrofolate reductase [NAD(P)H] [Spirochaetia bacterium]
MHISKILNSNNPALSFEFFPPKTDDASDTLFKTIHELKPLDPAYVSVTYGAGGSTRDLTHDLIVKLQKENNITVVSHLTCVGSSKDEIRDILKLYSKSGIENIMALRGDPPRGEKSFKPVKDGFSHASELVSFIKNEFSSMGIGIAGFVEGHPETPNRLLEMDYLKQKSDAGADYICTQLFFDNRDFYDFCERCEIENINIPIIAGIMPVVSRKNMNRMAELAGGARFPAKLLKAMQNANKEDEEKVGVEWTINQVHDLLKNKVRGIHFYTLNKSKAMLNIFNAIK